VNASLHCATAHDGPGVIRAAGGETFPFNTLLYASSLPHLGEVVTREAVDVPVLVRQIGRTGFRDGMLPWPYVALEGDDVERLRAGFPELVSVVGVIGPSSLWRWPGITEVVRFKDHFVLDPALPFHLSARSRANLRKGERRWSLREVAGRAAARTAAALYRRMAAFRGLAGTLFDFPVTHFERLMGVPAVRCFAVVDADGAWGSCCCGARFGDEFHLLHIAASADGLRSFAAHVLMKEVTARCIAQGVRLFLGGLPRTGMEGLERFKQRWTNTLRPTYLLRLVVQPSACQTLPAAPGYDGAFFPRYRTPW